MTGEHPTVELLREAVASPRDQRATPAASTTHDAGPEPPDWADLTPIEPRSLSTVLIGDKSQATGQPQSTSDPPISESLVTRVLVALIEDCRRDAAAGDLLRIASSESDIISEVKCALRQYKRIETFLRQGIDEPAHIDETRARLLELMEGV